MFSIYLLLCVCRDERVCVPQAPVEVREQLVELFLASRMWGGTQVDKRGNSALTQRANHGPRVVLCVLTRHSVKVEITHKVHGKADLISWAMDLQVLLFSEPTQQDCASRRALELSFL